MPPAKRPAVFLCPETGDLPMLKILIALAIIYLSIILGCMLIKLIVGLREILEIAKWERECEERIYGRD